MIKLYPRIQYGSLQYSRIQFILKKYVEVTSFYIVCMFGRQMFKCTSCCGCTVDITNSISLAAQQQGGRGSGHKQDQQGTVAGFIVVDSTP